MDPGRPVHPRPGLGPAARAADPNALQRRKADQIAALLADGEARIGALSDRDLLIAGAALYAGEGSKTDGSVRFANTDARMVVLFLTWLRRFFDVDERRLRIQLYLHDDLDLAAATRFWSEQTGIPPEQFTRPWRAVVDSTRRHNRHVHGCVGVSYGCSATHRAVMGLVRGLLVAPSGVAQLAEQPAVNR